MKLLFLYSEYKRDSKHGSALDRIDSQTQASINVTSVFIMTTISIAAVHKTSVIKYISFIGLI